MTSMVITPKNKSEMKLVSDLLKKMQIQTQQISEEISEQSIMSKLRRNEI